jgi:hypothetical protein|tara:strand:- start:758 stop:892 length:135 start_codon:yes stop_codon:yes gene_type:complete
MQLSNHQKKILNEIARKKQIKVEEYLMGLLLDQYQQTFKRPYHL